MEQAAPGRRQRFHSEEFKAQAVQACKQPGVSMASVAMANGVNANLLRRWVQASSQAESGTALHEAAPVGFIGVWLVARRLHQGRFVWPNEAVGGHMPLTQP